MRVCVVHGVDPASDTGAVVVFEERAHADLFVANATAIDAAEETDGHARMEWVITENIVITSAMVGESGAHGQSAAKSLVDCDPDTLEKYAGGRG